MPEKRRLTGMQAAFVREYLKDSNATQAAIRAGYSAKNADVQGPALLGIPWVRAEIEKHQEKLEKKALITVEELLQMRIEDYNFLREKEERYDKNGEPTGQTRMRDAAAASQAAEQISKMIGAYEKDNRRQVDAEIKFLWGADDTDD